MRMEELVERRIGYIYSEEGIYEPDIISFTVELGAKVEIGDIVCIEHPSRQGVPVFYQVFEVPVRRKARDYEEDLARVGKPLVDEARNYPRARARQIGFVESIEDMLAGRTSIDDLMMLVEHIRPLSEVYAPRTEVVEKLLEPGGPSVKVGSIYPNRAYSLKLELPRLLRQGLLVVGGVGTGKTTTMLTILLGVLEEVRRAGGRPHILIIDKDDEYGAPELVEEARRSGGYSEFHVEELGGAEELDPSLYARRLLSILGYADRRTKAAKLLAAAAEQAGLPDPPQLTPEYVEKHILPRIRDREARIDLNSRLAQWKRRYAPGRASTPLSRVLEELGVKAVVRIVLSKTRSWDDAFAKLDALLKAVYARALEDEGFGCIVVIDEAHLFAPESRGISLASEERVKSLRDTLHLIATTGPRNGVTPFIATQRPSLITKTITTQMGQNIIAHRVEDIDLGRIEEIMGPMARKARFLPRGWALVKALASKIREPLIVLVEARAAPMSTGKSTYYRFIPQIPEKTLGHPEA